MSGKSVLRVAVCGATGRMGGELARVAAADASVELVGGVAHSVLQDPAARGTGYPRLCPPGEAGDILRDADAVVDFSSPDALAHLLELHADALAERALVVGTTGLGAREEQRLDAAAERGPVLVAANFSVGVNVLQALVRRAARALGDYDAEIVEAHHAGKTDAPSGTALALGQALAAGRGVRLEDVRQDGRSGHTGARPAGQVGFHALRGGGVVGQHHVHFLGADERIELAHVALDRRLFARGALVAARWLVGRAPGRYTMAEVLGLDD